MQARMKNPAMIVPNAMQALHALGASAEKGGVPSRTLGLVQLRASQINGCSLCVDMHPRMLKQAGETDERLFALAAWRDAPYFSDAERAALALTEAITRLSDRRRPRPRRDLEGGDPALRRAGAGGADPLDCHHQRLEPPQRQHQAGGGLGAGLSARPAPGRVSGQLEATSTVASRIAAAEDPVPPPTPPDEPRRIRAVRGCGTPEPPGTRPARCPGGISGQRARQSSTAPRTAVNPLSPRPRSLLRRPRRARTARAALPSSRTRREARGTVQAVPSTGPADRRGPSEARRGAHSARRDEPSRRHAAA